MRVWGGVSERKRKREREHEVQNARCGCMGEIEKKGEEI